MCWDMSRIGCLIHDKTRTLKCHVCVESALLCWFECSGSSPLPGSLLKSDELILFYSGMQAQSLTQTLRNGLQRRKDCMTMAGSERGGLQQLSTP